METKDGLTRDEAREAIKILTLRKDNLDIISGGVGSVVVTLFLAGLTVFFATITIKFSNETYPHLSNLFGLASVYLLIILAMLISSIIFLFILLCWSYNIKKRANKLAQKYNLEEFYNAILDK